MVHYAGQGSGTGGGSAAAGTTFVPPGTAPVVAAVGDLEGNGTEDVVIGRAAAAGDRHADDLEVYRIGGGEPAHQVGLLAAFDATGKSNSATFALGDVVPTERGQEVIVGADGSQRPATELRIFGGMASGAFRLLARVRALRGRDAAPRPLSFAVGEAVATHAGDEIIVGDRRGRVAILGMNGVTAARLLRFAAFPDPPQTAAAKLAVGDLIPSNPGGEIVVADDGTRGDALVRVFDAATGRLLADFNAFPAGLAPAGVELWVADVIRTMPGAELIVGQGSAGGIIRVFSLASGTPRHILDLRASVHRTTSLPRQLAVGVLMPEFRGNQIAVAQSDSQLPIEVFSVRQGRSHLLDSIAMPDVGGQIESVTIGP